ncbi:MAG: hypothetical protein ACXVEF_19250 [Polyangiales bacterium]
MRRLSFAFPLLLLACSSSPEDASPADDAQTTESGSDTTAPDETGSDTATDSGSDSTSETPVETTCIDATGSGTAATNVYVDGSDQTTVTASGTTCARSYTFDATADLLDGLPKTRTVTEAAGKPIVRTKNVMFDALYALALDEVRENSVSTISDGAFNGGMPIPCDCFQTGRKWTYVWTRDTSYSVFLGLAAIDPTRARKSLEFKLSELRAGGGREIVQDTGSGGSHPISTDRVVWAMGAQKTMEWLSGDELTAFRTLAWDAIKNTVERDRALVYDASDGLYRGEQSFLDWREQTYPAWTASDVVHIGMSKALSTNVAHATMLRIASEIASASGDSAASTKYAMWASDLRAKIAAKMWLPEQEQLSSHLTTFLDPAPTVRFDALGTSLAVLEGVASPTQAKSAIARYPHLSRGVPVIWPQQKETAIYHNRSIWPFVTAFFAKAGKQAQNDAVVENAVRSLMRGAAINLSNMENFEMVSGKPHVDDGAYSGPVVDSQRQLWSVAGYLSMVNDVLFGMETSASGIRFQPFVPKKIRDSIFANADSIALDGISYKGQSISVTLILPPKGTGTTGGSLTASSVKVNGASVAKDAWLTLTAKNVVEITLADSGAPAADIALVTSTTDYKELFGPRAPNVTSIDGSGANLKISWDPNGESTGEVAFDVYRDGVRVAKDLTTTSFTDTGATASSPSYCYAVDAHFTGSKNHGQHSPPSCWWGTGYVRTKSIDASAFTAKGGASSTSHGKLHYDNWGDPGDTLTASYASTRTGEHLLQVSYGNGAGPISTGITCVTKLVRVLDGGTEIARGYLVMPQLGDWDTWKDSSLVRANLVAGKTYTIEISDDGIDSNMSRFQHFASYVGTGGSSGAFSKVNIAELKVLARVP